MEIVFVFAVAIALLHLSNIWKSFAIPSRSVRPGWIPAIFYAFFLLLSIAVLFFVLLRWSDREVRSDWTEIVFYLLFSLAWILAAQEIFALIGISWRDDFVERRNVSAAIAVGGFTLGATFCTAGANIGNGPGWWVVLFCAALSTCTLLALWIILNWTTKLSDTITIERDLGCGIRAGGYLAAAGLTLGISVSGDWKSVSETFSDFLKTAWPIAFVLAALSFYERLVQRRKNAEKKPSFGISIAIAAGMIAASTAYAWKIGIR